MSETCRIFVVQTKRDNPQTTIKNFTIMARTWNTLEEVEK